MLGREGQGEAAGNRVGSGSEGQGGPGRTKREREAALKRRGGKSEEQLGASRTGAEGEAAEATGMLEGAGRKALTASQ